ncbi:hypothetical protein [Aeromicrobium chenweiae]|nr:hypothetical protein [Aeromicrobium chenweiae]
MEREAPEKAERNEWRGRAAVVLVLAPAAILLAGIVVWFVFLPPFSGM